MQLFARDMRTIIKTSRVGKMVLGTLPLVITDDEKFAKLMITRGEKIVPKPEAQFLVERIFFGDNIFTADANAWPRFHSLMHAAFTDQK